MNGSDHVGLRGLTPSAGGRSLPSRSATRSSMRSLTMQYLVTTRRCAGDTPDDTTVVGAGPCPGPDHHFNHGHGPLAVTLSDRYWIRHTITISSRRRGTIYRYIAILGIMAMPPLRKSGTPGGWGSLIRYGSGSFRKLAPRSLILTVCSNVMIRNRRHGQQYLALSNRGG